MLRLDMDNDLRKTVMMRVQMSQTKAHKCPVGKSLT